MQRYLLRAFLLAAGYLVVSFLRHQVWSSENGFVLYDAIVQAVGWGALMAIFFRGRLKRRLVKPASGEDLAYEREAKV